MHQVPQLLLLLLPLPRPLLLPPTSPPPSLTDCQYYSDLWRGATCPASRWSRGLTAGESCPYPHPSYPLPPQTGAGTLGQEQRQWPAAAEAGWQAELGQALHEQPVWGLPCYDAGGGAAAAAAVVEVVEVEAVRHFS